MNWLTFIIKLTINDIVKFFYKIYLCRRTYDGFVDVNGVTVWRTITEWTKPGTGGWKVV